MDTTQGVDLSNKVSTLDSLWDELQYKIYHNQSYALKNLNNTRDKLANLELLLN